VQPPLLQDSSGVVLTQIDSANVLAMQDEAFSELLSEINEKAGRSRLSVVLASIFGIGGCLSSFALGALGLWLVALALPAWLIGKWLDSYKRRAVLFYEFDADHQGAYTKLTTAFDELSSCAGKWHVQASGAIHDMTTRKRNAGATRLVSKVATSLDYRLPEVVTSNVTPPALRVGLQTLYFLPDVVLVGDGKAFGSVAYADLRVLCQASRFIEDGRVPSDAQVVDHTWRYPNKSGGRDRRFNNNKQIPVCLYHSLSLSSPGGLNEQLEFSRVGPAESFALALHEMPPSKTAGPAPAVSAVQPVQEPLAPVDITSKPRRRALTVVLTVVALVGVYLVWGMMPPAKQGQVPPPGPFVAATQTPSAPPVPPPAPATRVETKALDIAASAPRQAPALTPTPSPAPPDDRPLSWAEVREVQEVLKALGFDPGDIDGIPGPQTAGAIRRFEASRGMPSQGKLDRATLQKLREAKPAR